MNKKEQHITLEQILAVIDNSSELEILFNRLKQENVLDEELKGVKLFLEQNDYDSEKLKAFLLASESKFDELENNTSTTAKINWLKIAAVIIPLAGVGLYFLWNNPSQQEQLYHKYYEKELGLPVVLSVNEDKLFNESMNLYREGDYKNAYQGFEQLLKNKENDTLDYFAGVCLMEMQQNMQASIYLQKDYSGSFFKEKAEFRLALVLLKMDKTKELKKVLTNIIKNKNHRYFAEAQSLLRELK